MWLNFIPFDLWKCVICPFMKPLRLFLPSGVQYMKLFICISYIAFQIYHQLKSFLNRIRRMVVNELVLSFGTLRFLSL